MKNKTKFKEFISKSQKLWIIAVVIILLTILQPGVFLTASNFKSILLSISVYGIMVCGTIFPVLLGGIDLSVGATAATSGAFTVLVILKYDYSTAGVLLGIVGGLAIGLLVGLIHGIVVSVFNVPAFLVTLASQNIIYGVAQLLTNSQVISCLKPKLFTFLGGGRLLGIPFSIYIMLLMVVISYVILNKTVLGRSVYAVGGNIEASNLSGVKSRKVQIIAYMASGFTAALAGIVLASMNQQAIAKAAQGYDNDVLTAIVVGGTSLMGGEGSIQGAAWGALLVGMVSNGLRLMGVPTNYHGIFKGLIIIFAVALDASVRYRNSGLKKGGVKKKKVVKTA